MTHTQFCRQLIMFPAMPQALLTLCMRESVKATAEGRVQLVAYLQQQYPPFKDHEQSAQTAFATANSQLDSHR